MLHNYASGGEKVWLGMHQLKHIKCVINWFLSDRLPLMYTYCTSNSSNDRAMPKNKHAKFQRVSHVNKFQVNWHGFKNMKRYFHIL